MTPYYEHGGVTIYHGDFRGFMSTLDAVDVVITDPPYGDTSLKWDVWQDGWPTLVANVSTVLWCFGSLRMFLNKSDEFSEWKLAQDIVWEKHNGTNASNDRFRRIHELCVQFYRGEWQSIFKKPLFTHNATKRTGRRTAQPPHWGKIGACNYTKEEGGPKMQTSVIYCRNCHSTAVHPTQKPEGIIRPLIDYSVPKSGTVLDPFMGSGTTLMAAREAGCRAIGIEVNERYCESAAKRLAQEMLQLT